MLLTTYKSAVAVAVTFSVVILGYGRFRRLMKVICGADNDLPMGLPNPRNICYLNALLQAMSTNASLVRFLKKQARARKSRLLYCLVCLLKGLRCSNRYIIAHNLENTLRSVHSMLLAELSQVGNWSVHDQQDAHELFSFFMDLACHQSVGHTALKADEGLTSFSQFIGPRYEQIAPRCLHRAHMHSSPSSYTLRSPLQTEVFQQHLLVSQVTCQNCDYRGSPVLQPEACLTIFFDTSSSLISPLTHRPPLNKKMSDNTPAHPAPKLTDCLSKQFGVSEHLSDLRCPKCQHLNDQTGGSSNPGQCQQDRWIAHLPPCLVLHVQRSAWTGSRETQWAFFGLGSKRSDYLQFPYRLNMAKYMLSGRSSTPLGHHRNGSGDFIVRNALSQMHARQPRTYVLRSVLVHQGELMTSGHYVTYRSWRRVDPTRLKHHSAVLRVIRRATAFLINFFHGIVQRPVQPTSPWVLTSDVHVLRVSGEEVRSSLAYLLFYEREPSAAKVDRDVTRCTRSSDKMNGSLTSISSVFDDREDWDLGDADKSGAILEETDDECDLYGVEDDGDESDEPSDPGDEFLGCSKAEVIRACALAASRV